MKLPLFALLALAASSSAFAANQPEQIRCSFTESFLNLEWNEDTGVLGLASPDHVDLNDQGQVVLVYDRKPGFRKIQTGARAFEIRSEREPGLVLRLVLDFQGNNGMNDAITPYSAWLNGEAGACSSSLYKDKR